ncbi:MAG: 3-oxoacyl-ACP reductase FabG [Burkholderiales bacterium]|jgi:3-oxoacyl-[acyl-carrier protein] reductase|nr:3-oxoacyl-ACP reductase FabG [Burkholderiales bacterium]
MNHDTAALSGRLALVTGASRGIGRAIALELGRLGATVIGTATTEAGAQGITDTLAAAGYAGRGAVLDVADAAATEALIAAIGKAEGAPAILVNNAGITRDNLALRMKDEEWSAVIDTNLSAVFRLSRGVMRGMTKARWGRIVNITSVVGESGNAGQANYAAAKAGVAGMTRALAQELGSRNITVNCVAPGFIDTDMTRALAAEQTAALLQKVPLGRFGDVAEVAATVGFLCSPLAGYITGNTLHVNGGMYMA